MNRRCLILANPKAGGLKRFKQADAQACLTSLKAAALAAGLDAVVEIAPASPQLKPRLLRAQSEGYDIIAAAGGDGTVRPIAQALVGSPLRLGILPVGTANNFARSLGLPSDLEGAMHVLASGRERLVDVGRIGSEDFTEAAGVGLFAAVISAFGPDGPRLSTLMRDIKVLLPLWWNPPARRLHLVLDGVVYAEQAVMVSVCNSVYLGAGFAMAPDANLGDGLFDVIIVGALSRWELLRFGTALLRGRDVELPKVSRLQARTVEISRLRRSRYSLPVHADDHIASYTPAHLEIIPSALRVIGIAPSDAGEEP